MSRPAPFERRTLAPAEEALLMASVGAGTAEAASVRLEVLEAASAALAGYGVVEFRKRYPVARSTSSAEATVRAEPLLRAISQIDVPPPLALASLAQPALEELDRRQSGAYYTDFRLAQYAAGELLQSPPAAGVIVDPACGSGMLLAAVAHRAIATHGVDPDDFVARSLVGVDLSQHALRSAVLVLASMAPDPDVVRDLRGRFRRADSLVAASDFWEELSSPGISAVIANPPWEKLKLSRHELLLKSGVTRHYGQEYDLERLAEIDLHAKRDQLDRYVKGLTGGFQHQGSGERDLYKLFVELAFKLAAPQGDVCLIVPAGLIRAQGAERLRALMLGASRRLTISILHNRARFFAIDTRFKFLVVHAQVGSTSPQPLELRHAYGRGTKVIVEAQADIPRRELASVRPDLTVPEVATQADWELFSQLMRTGQRLDSSAHWRMDFMRELDMTNDVGLFSKVGSDDDAFPLVEGRMVHQYRFPAKRYIAGSGRRAIWRVAAPGSRVEPQYWVRPADLPAELLSRCALERIGFCDVTGQTNERSMLAAVIPSGVVCGNKVPTLVLQGSHTADLARGLWLAIANSFAFDWLLRRVVTTSLNYFVLRSLAFPSIWVDDVRGQRLARKALQLSRAEGQHHDGAEWTRATLRAEIDAEVAIAWGISFEGFDRLLGDFPLLDRGQPVLPGESKSTVSRDHALWTYAQLTGEGSDLGSTLSSRVDAARALGALSFTASEHAAASPAEEFAPVAEHG